ncbi:MAG: pyridoxamine 5'-phosphate oxidase family protein [Chloroflexia bacterium]
MTDLDDVALRILNGRHIATLATQNGNGLIHLTAVWYMYKDGNLFVTTNSKSRKFRNIERSSTASMMIDTRKPGFEYGLTASGTTCAIKGDKARLMSCQIHERYLTEKALSDPQISGFFAAYDDVVIRLSPQSWVSWDMGQPNMQCFDGKLSTETGYLYPFETY